MATMLEGLNKLNVSICLQYPIPWMGKMW
jgi:hypothetical protein